MPWGRTFADVLNDPAQPLDAFFSDPDRQRRMEESEIHHDRSPLSGVVWELEAQPEINAFRTEVRANHSTRLRQCIGVVVRIIMESRRRKKTGEKVLWGSVLRSQMHRHRLTTPADWRSDSFAEKRYEHEDGMPYSSVKDRCKELESIPSQGSTAGKRPSKAVRK